MVFMNRFVELLIAIILAPAVIPIVGIAIVCIVSIDRVSPFFVQNRLGRFEKPFAIYKLRTMKPGIGNLGTHEADPLAILRTGYMLRRLKVDELPQILNVLLGNMSFVGPRPGLPTQTLLASERRELGVFAVRPGITGMGQVLGVDMSTPVQLAKIDASYIETRTWRMDLLILWATLSGKGFRDAVGISACPKSNSVDRSSK